MKVQQGNNKLLLHKDRGYASVRIEDKDVSFSIRLCMCVCACTCGLLMSAFSSEALHRSKSSWASELLLDETDTDTDTHIHTHRKCLPPGRLPLCCLLWRCAIAACGEWGTGSIPDHVTRNCHQGQHFAMTTRHLIAMVTHEAGKNDTKG